MPLRSVGNTLLQLGGKLLLSCCEVCFPKWCNSYFDECGNLRYRCGALSQSTVGECTPECDAPEKPCECGPDVPCATCYECQDGTCVRLEDCCADGTPCPECMQCIDGTCVPCGECQQCIDGLCVPCGPCQTCVDGECGPCPDGYECKDGVCVPKQYYCCYTECPSPANQTPTTYCSTTPCGTSQDYKGDSCSLTKGGPYGSINACNQNCSKYKCAPPNACGYRECVQDPNGVFESLDACRAACPEDPCASPCTFEGADAPGTYSIDACERDICVSYISRNSRPIRVQIRAPVLDANCNIVATEVVKSDSDWRGEECCDCPDLRNGGDLQGGSKGQIRWKKPRGVTTFTVVVLNPCGADYGLDIACTDQCGDLGTPQMCPCDVDADCNLDADCHCCCGECKQECRDNCDEFADWTLEAKFCDATLVWSASGEGNTGLPGFPRRVNFGSHWLIGSYSIIASAPPVLSLVEECFVEEFDPITGEPTQTPNPNAHKCVGSISITADGPSNGNYYFCVRTYSADIVDGELKNIQRNFPNNWAIPDICDCDSQDIEVTITYNPLP